MVPRPHADLDPMHTLTALLALTVLAGCQPDASLSELQSASEPQKSLDRSEGFLINDPSLDAIHASSLDAITINPAILDVELGLEATLLEGMETVVEVSWPGELTGEVFYDDGEVLRQANPIETSEGWTADLVGARPVSYTHLRAHET